MNVVDVEERVETQKASSGWKADGEGPFFSDMIVPLNLDYRCAPTLHAS